MSLLTFCTLMYVTLQHCYGGAGNLHLYSKDKWRSNGGGSSSALFDQPFQKDLHISSTLWIVWEESFGCFMQYLSETKTQTAFMLSCGPFIALIWDRQQCHGKLSARPYINFEDAMQYNLAAALLSLLYYLWIKASA